MVYAKDGDLHQRQEAVVLHYLGQVLMNIEVLPESRIMPTLRERGVTSKSHLFYSCVHSFFSFYSITAWSSCTLLSRQVLMLGAQFIRTFHEALPRHTLLACIKSLALLVESEDFSTYRNIYIGADDGCLEVLLELKENW
jgi:hypothetical protein